MQEGVSWLLKSHSIWLLTLACPANPLACVEVDACFYVLREVNLLWPLLADTEGHQLSLRH